MLLHLLQEYFLHILLIVGGGALVYWISFRPRGIHTMTRIDQVLLNLDREGWLRNRDYRYFGTYRIDHGTPMVILLNAYLSADGIKARFSMAAPRGHDHLVRKLQAKLDQFAFHTHSEVDNTY